MRFDLYVRDKYCRWLCVGQEIYSFMDPNSLMEFWMLAKVGIMNANDHGSWNFLNFVMDKFPNLVEGVEPSVSRMQCSPSLLMVQPRAISSYLGDNTKGSSFPFALHYSHQVSLKVSKMLVEDGILDWFRVSKHENGLAFLICNLRKVPCSFLEPPLIRLLPCGLKCFSSFALIGINQSYSLWGRWLTWMILWISWVWCWFLLFYVHGASFEGQ